MTTLIINIKELLQVREFHTDKISGATMAVLPTIKDAYLLIENDIIKDYGLMILRKLFVKKVEQKQPANLIPIKQNNQEIFNVRPIIRLMLLTARFNTPLYNNQELYHD